MIASEQKERKNNMDTATKKNRDLRRIINSGKEITLKKIGDVTVRELALEDVLKLSQELVEVLEAIQGDGVSGATDGMGVIVSLMKTPATSRALRVVAAATTEQKPADFEKMGVADWLKWANAFKEVADWEELRELFIQLVPKNLFNTENLTTKQSPPISQNLSTVSPTVTVGRPKRS